jgi:hypothetical protein
MMYEFILIDLLRAAQAEFTKINADLAATSRNLKATGTMADGITGVTAKHAASHREFSAFTPDGGRA